MLPRPTLELMFESYCAPLRTGMRYCIVGQGVTGELMAGDEMNDAIWDGVRRDNLPWGQLAWPVYASAGAVTLLPRGRTIEPDMWVWHCDAPGWQQASHSGFAGLGANNRGLVAATVTWHQPHSDRPLDQYAQRWGRVGEQGTQKFEVLVGTKPIRRVYFLTYPLARPNWLPDGSYQRPYTSLDQAAEATHGIVENCTEFIGILSPGTVQTMAFRAIDPHSRRLVFRLAPWSSEYCKGLPHPASERGEPTPVQPVQPSRDLLNAISSTSLAIAAVAKAASELNRRDDPIFPDQTLDERRRTLSRLELQLGVVLAEFSKQLPNVVERVLPVDLHVDPQFELDHTPLFPVQSGDALQQP